MWFMGFCLASSSGITELQRSIYKSWDMCQEILSTGSECNKIVHCIFSCLPFIDGKVGFGSSYAPSTDSRRIVRQGVATVVAAEPAVPSARGAPEVMLTTEGSSGRGGVFWCCADTGWRRYCHILDPARQTGAIVPTAVQTAVQPGQHVCVGTCLHPGVILCQPCRRKIRVWISKLYKLVYIEKGIRALLLLNTHWKYTMY